MCPAPRQALRPRRSRSTNRPASWPTSLTEAKPDAVYTGLAPGDHAQGHGRRSDLDGRGRRPSGRTARSSAISTRRRASTRSWSSATIDWSAPSCSGRATRAASCCGCSRKASRSPSRPSTCSLTATPAMLAGGRRRRRPAGPAPTTRRFATATPSPRASIVAAIQAGKCTVAALGECTKAGTGCGTCQPLLASSSTCTRRRRRPRRRNVNKIELMKQEKDGLDCLPDVLPAGRAQQLAGDDRGRQAALQVARPVLPQADARQLHAPRCAWKPARPTPASSASSPTCPTSTARASAT